MSRDDPSAALDLVAELAAVTGGLVHEIRNPLSTLKVNLQLLAEDWRELAEREPAAGEDVRRSLARVDTMIREIDRLADLLERFHRYAGPHELQREACDLNEFVRGVAEFFAPQAAKQQVGLTLDLSSDALAVLIDVNRMKQAILNLLLNALQAMPDGGELTLRTRANESGCVLLEISDTGHGIPPAQMARVFDLYFSTRKGGTGLGLPTARRVILEHDGRIDVSSRPDEGTTFTITLPVATNQSHD